MQDRPKSLKRNSGGPSSLAKWAIPVAGFAAALVTATMSVILIRQYMASRPLDLAPANEAMVQHIQDLLRQCHLSSDSIKVYEPLPQDDKRARWNLYAFDVGVPPNMRAEKVLTALEQGMAFQNVSATESESPDGRFTELRFSLLDRDFAVVRILGGAERYDLTAACETVARDVRHALTNMPGVDSVEQLTAQDRRDGPVKWRAYMLKARAGAYLDPDSVRKSLAESLSEIDGEIPQVAAASRPDSFDVFWRSRPVVRMQLVRETSPFIETAPDYLSDLKLLHEKFPLLFRSLFGFEPEAPPLAAGATSDAGVDEPQLPAEAEPEKTSNPEPAAAAPRAAIIVDDGGYGGLASDAILTMDSRLTLAILPNTPFARETAEKAGERGFEIMLHMPLESEDSQNAFPGEMTTVMEAAQLESTLVDALEDVPGAAGVNNHTGSKFTADTAAMTRLLQLLKKHNFYFVDSRTTSETVAEEVARTLQVPSASRSVFLDNESDPDYIRAQVAALAAAAKTEAAAIGICHFRATTAAMLPEMVRLLENEGITLVHASELVQ